MPSSQSLTLKARGRYTSVNELSEVPEGALLEADDVVIDQDGLVEPRRGFKRPFAQFDDVDDRADQLFKYQGKLFAHLGTYLSADQLYYWDSGWQSVGSVSAPSPARLHSAEAGGNVYLTTSEGVKVLDAFDGTLRQAGAYKALDTSTALNAAGSGYLANGSYVAYRVVWGFRDANQSLILGAPSARSVIRNNAGGGATKNVDVTVTIPQGVSTDWIYQVYRSASTTAAEPSDDLQLVYEGSPSGGDISTGYLTVTDIVDDALRGPALYTNVAQEGLAYGNEPPPLAKDIAVWNDVTFYADLVSKHRFYLTLIAVGGSSGLVANDTVTFGGVTFTAKASPSLSTEFTVSTGGTAAQNIKDTATALCQKVNRHASCTVYAFYLSGPDDTPGKILLEERGLGAGSFYVTSSRATCWTPAGIPTSGTTQPSTNDESPNGLCWSKPNQPAAVPLVNYKGGGVGSKAARTLRIKALRDALIILKEDGLWKLTGSYPNFSIEPFDNSAILIAPESVAVLNNAVHCLTDQGVVAISDGTLVRSRPIETDIKSMFGDGLEALKSMAFGVAFESERKYYLFMPAGIDDASPTVAHVYNTFTQAWVRHLLSKTCGIVSDNQLYLSDANGAYVEQERRSFTFLDYCDPGADTAITAQSGSDGEILTLDSNSDAAAPGDVLYQSDSLFAIIIDVDTIAGTVTVDAAPTFDLTDAQILKAIPARVTWAPITLANPGVLKTVHTATAFFKDDFYGSAELTFKTDLVPVEGVVPVAGLGLSVWGLFPWGEEPWGGDPIRRPARQWIPRDYQQCSQLILGFSHAYAFSPWKLQGVTVFGDVGSEKVSK